MGYYYFVLFWYSLVSVLAGVGAGWFVMFFAKTDTTNVRSMSLLVAIAVAIFTASLSVSLINLGVK